MKTTPKKLKTSKMQERKVPQRIDNVGNEDTSSGDSDDEDAMEEGHEDKNTAGKKQAAATRAEQNSVALIRRKN